MKPQSNSTTLQEVEEWLLQMSFPFMSLSCLHISNLFRTEKQPSKYQIPLKEIRDYKNIIHDCKKKVCILRDQEQSPTEQEDTNKQLSDIQEGYDLLLLAAEHIQFTKCSAWLTAMKSLVQSYTTSNQIDVKPQNGLLEKKTCYEEFQEHLETISNWKSEFDKLNVKNDLLSNTHLDSNSGAFTQSSVNYNTLSCMSETLMHEMEHGLQEHQQQCMFDECIKLIGVSRVHLMEHLRMIIVETVKDNLAEFNMASMKDQVLQNALSNWSDSNAFPQLSSDYDALVSHSEEVLDKLKLNFQDHQRLEYMYGECVKLIDMSRAYLKACGAEVNSIDDVNTKKSNLKSLGSTVGQMKDVIQGILELTGKVILNTDVKGIACIKEAFKSYSIAYEKLLIDTAEVIRKITSQRLEADHQMHPASESETSNQYEIALKLINAHIAQLEVDGSKLEKYKNLHAAAETWLRDALIKLQNLEKEVDSQETVQLKMKEFLSFKESLLNRERLIKECTTLGETISNSLDLPGRERINQETSNINDAFSLIQKLAVDVEVKLSHCLAVWTEFEDAYHETKKLLKAFESEFRPSLATAASYQDENNRLKLLKEFLAKAVEKETNVNNVNQLCEKIVEVTTCTAARDRTVALSKMHSTITENLKDAINKLENVLSCYREFFTARKQFVQWLNEKRLSLKMNKSPDGNTNALESQLQNLKVIEVSLPDGQLLLNTACDRGTKVLDDLQESSKNVIQEKIEQMKRRFSNFSDSTKEVAEKLSSLLTRLQNFARNSSKFREWIGDIEPKLKGTPVIEGDLIENEKKLEYFKKIHADITFRLSQMNEMKKESEELVSITSDQGHSLAVTDLSKRLSAAAELSENAINKLENALCCYGKFSTAREEFVQWLNEKRLFLETNRSPDGNSNALESKQQNLKIIQESLPDGQLLLNTACESGAKVMDMLQEPSKNVMQEQIEHMKQDFSNLCDSTKKVAEHLSSVFTRLQAFARNSSEFEEWIEDIDPKLKDIPVFSEPMEMKKKLEYYKKIHADITFRQSQMNEMKKESEELVSITSDQGHSLAVTDLSKRLFAAAELSENAINKLENALCCYGKFSTAREEFVQWLNEKRLFLETNRSPDGNSNALESKQQNLKIIQESLPDGQLLLNTACESGAKFLDMLQEPSKNVMQEQIEHMKQDFSNLCDSTKEVAEHLSSVFTRLQAFARNSSEFEEWIEDIDPKLKDIPVFSEPMEMKKKLEYYKKIHADITFRQSQMNEMKKESEELVSITSDQGHSLAVIDLSQRLFAAAELSENAINKLENALCCYGKFSTAREQFVQWLNEKRLFLETNRSPDVNSNALESKQQNLKIIQESLLDGQLLLNTACESGAKVLDMLQEPSKNVMQEQIEHMKQDFSNLCDSTKEVAEHLSSVFTRLQAFARNSSEFEEWIEDIDPKLKDIPFFSEPMEMKKKLEYYKEIHADVTFRQSQMNEMKKESEELVSITGYQDHSLAVTDLSKRLIVAAEGSEDAINKLEKLCRSASKEQTAELLNEQQRSLETNKTPDDDRNPLENKPQNPKVIEEPLPNGQLLLDTACDSGTKVLSESEGKASPKNVMQEQIEQMRQDFSNLHDSTNEVVGLLSSVYATLQEFAQNSSKFKEWIKGIKPQLKESPVIESDRLQIEKKLEYFEFLLKEIQDYQHTIDDVKSKGYGLISICIRKYPELHEQISQRLTNIQESYDSLLQFAENIQAELEDALQKFNHYEKSFHFCEKLVIEVGLILKEAENDPSHQSLENAKRKLDSRKEILTRLTDAEDQLRNATQECTEVITSVSCSPSPDVGFSSSMLEKGIQIKNQLRDLIKQAQLDIATFSGIVDEWNSVLQMKSWIGEWIAEQDDVILAMESADLSDSKNLIDGHCLEEIKLQIEEKRSSIDEIEGKERKNNPDASETDLKAKLKDLDDKVKNLIIYITQKTKFNEAQLLLAETENQTRLSNEKIDAIETETGISQKQQLIQEMSQELDSIINDFKKRKVSFFESKAVLQDEDYQKLQADIKLVERKLDDLKKRMMKEVQNLELVQTTINDLQSKLSLIKEWLLKKLNEFTSSPLPGFKSQNIKCSLQNISSLQHEAKKQKLVISAIEGQVVSLGTYVNNDCELPNELEVVKEKSEELAQVLEQTANKLKSFLSKSIRMEKNIETISKWFSEKVQFLHQAKHGATKLKDLEKTRSFYCDIKNVIKDFEETRMKGIFEIGKELEEACTSEHHMTLRSFLNEFETKFNELKTQFEAKFEKIDGLVSQHKDLCGSQAKIQSSLNNIEVVLSEELRLNDGIKAILEQKNKYQSLFEETVKFSEEIERLQMISKPITEQICETDKNLLITELETQKDYHHQFQETICERLKTLEECILKQREMKVAEAMVKIKQALSEIEAQNKSLRISSDETIKPIQDSKESATITERYHILINEVSAAIANFRETTCAISNTKHSAHIKLRDFNTTSSRILNCEAKLKEAQEICWQIVEKNCASDHNSIMDELQRLRNQLNELKELVRSLKAKHKQLINEQSKICYDLNNCVKFLCQHQELLGSRPQLTLSKEVVQNEISKYQALLEKIQDYQNVIDNVKSESSILADKSPKFHEKVNQRLINIQESHNFLCSSIEDTQTHLKAALQSFCPCEETLQFCEKLVNDVVPNLEEAEMSYSSLEDTEEKLENYEKILTNLTSVEDRLENDVQECVVAITSITRTPNPDIEVSSTLVEKINEIEIQLRDSIKLARSKTSLLPDIINEWKSLLNQKSLLEEWLIKEEKIILAMELTSPVSDYDILTRNLHQLQDIQQQIEEKLLTIDEIEAKERRFNSNAMEDDFRSKLKDLEKKVGDLTKEHDGQRATFEVQLHFHEIEKQITLSEEKLDAVEKLIGVGPIEKQKLIENISEELISIANHIEEIKSLANDLQPLLGDESYQEIQADRTLIEENLEKLEKRCMKMIEHLQSVQINQSNCIKELNTIKEWLLEKLSKLRRLPPPGFQRHNIECRFRNVSDLHGEVKDKVLNIFSVERRLSSLEKDIDNYESLYDELKDVKEKIEEVIHVLEPMASELKALASESIQMEKSIEEVSNWLTERKQFLSETENAKGNIEHLKKAKSMYNDLKDTFNTFEETKVRDIYTFEKDLEKACTSEHKEALHSLLNGTQSKFDGLKKEFEEKFKEIDALVAEHENLCSCQAALQYWLNKTDLYLSQKLNLNVDIISSEEQRRQHKSFHEEAEKLSRPIKKLKPCSEVIMKYMKETDKSVLRSKIQTQTEHFNRLQDTIHRRLQTLEEYILEQKEVLAMTEKGVEEFELLQSEIKLLNKTIGISPDDALELVQNYETILNRLREKENQLRRLKPCENLAQRLNNLIENYYLAIRSVQEKQSKAKESAATRKQYQTLIREITKMITTSKKTLQVTKETEHSVDKKFSCYTDMYDVILNHERKILEAQDKGKQIGEEDSSVLDSVTGNVEKLGNEINILKKLVQSLKTKHEHLIAERNKLCSDFRNSVEVLLQYQDLMKLKPLLKRENILDKISKHQEKTVAIEKQFENACTLRLRINSELSHEIVVSTLQKQLNDFDVLQRTLPEMTKEYEEYLKVVLHLLDEFDLSKQGLMQWFTEAENFLCESKFEIDIRNSSAKLKRLEDFITNVNGKKDELMHIEKLCAQIRVSLEESQRFLLDGEVSSLKQKLTYIAELADKMLSETKIDVKSCEQYLELSEKVTYILNSLILPTEKLTALPNLHQVIQNISKCLAGIQIHQSSIKDLNEKANVLDGRVNTTSKKIIRHQLLVINKQWEEILCKLENQLFVFKNILTQWEKYTEVHFGVLQSIQDVEGKFNKFLISKALSEDILTVFFQETKELKEPMDNVQSLLTSVLNSLAMLPSDEISKQLQKEFQSLKERYQKLLTDAENKLNQVREESETINKLEINLLSINGSIETLKQKVKTLDYYMNDVPVIHKDMVEIRNDVTEITKKVKSIIEVTKEPFVMKKVSMPATISKSLSSLGALSNLANDILENNERECACAQNTCMEFSKAVVTVFAWLRKAQMELQSKSILPEAALDSIKLLLSEIPTINEHLNAVCNNGQLIIENATHLTNREAVQSTLTFSKEQASQVNSWIHKKHKDIKDAIIAEENFLKLQDLINSSIEEVENIHPREMKPVSLQTLKSRLEALQVLDEKQNQSQQFLKEMSKCLEKITEVFIAGNLPDLLAALQQKQSSACSCLQEEISFLEKTFEEWEKCKRKINEVSEWVEKTEAHLNSVQFGNRLSREQLSSKNILLKELQDYQIFIDDISSKGDILVDIYEGQSPSLHDQISQQLTDIQESYNVLLLSAENASPMNSELPYDESYTSNQEDEDATNHSRIKHYCDYILRGARPSFRIKALTMLLLLGATAMFSMSEEELSFQLFNKFGISFQQSLSFPLGPPTV